MTAQCPSPRRLAPVFRRMAAALALTGAVLMLESATAGAGDPIRVGYVSTSLASTPIVVADAKGYFKDEGLDAALVGFESSDAIALAVASGDVDFGTTGVSNPFFVLGKAGSLKIIGGDDDIAADRELVRAGWVAVLARLLAISIEDRLDTIDRMEAGAEF